MPYMRVGHYEKSSVFARTGSSHPHTASGQYEDPGVRKLRKTPLYRRLAQVIGPPM